MRLIQSAVSLPVANGRASFDFYRSVFGDERVSFEERTVALALPGSVVFFIEREAFDALLKPAQVECTFATGQFASMLSATVATRDEAYAALKAAEDAGGYPCGQAVHYPWGMASYFEDLDRHLWEILWLSGK